MPICVILAGCAAGTTAGVRSAGVDTAGAPTAVTANTTIELAGDAQREYDAVLAEVGVDIAGAQNAAVVLGDAEFCGWDQVGPTVGAPRTDLAARRCFVGAHIEGRSALFLLDTRTNEGDPVPLIYRTVGGRVTVYGDWTRDGYGTREWREERCHTLYIASYDSESPPRLVFSCFPWDESGVVGS